MHLGNFKMLLHLQLYFQMVLPIKPLGYFQDECVIAFKKHKCRPAGSILSAQGILKAVESFI